MVMVVLAYISLVIYVKDLLSKGCISGKIDLSPVWARCVTVGDHFVWDSSRKQGETVSTTFLASSVTWI